MYKDIPGYEGLYSVNEFGEVIVSDRHWVTGKGVIRFKPSHKLRQFMKQNGYWHTQLTKNGKMKQYAVHQLVAMAFLPNPENKKCVNHKNGIKTDNSASNLEWSTYKENNVHALRNGMRVLKRSSLTGKYIKA